MHLFWSFPIAICLVQGMTKIKMAKTEEEAASIDFVEKRRAALERYLNRIGKHKVLLQDPDFRDFLEQDDVSSPFNKYIYFLG